MTFGSAIGQVCSREKDGGWTDDCGIVCQDSRAQASAIFCPPGFKPDCVKGCEWPSDAQAHPVAEQVAVLKASVQLLVAQTGVVKLQHEAWLREFSHSCGCDQARGMFPVSWGDKVGSSCFRLPENKQPAYSAECGPVCSNEHGEATIIFCPRGFIASCAGCAATGEDKEL